MTLSKDDVLDFISLLDEIDLAVTDLDPFNECGGSNDEKSEKHLQDAIRALRVRLNASLSAPTAEKEETAE